MTHLCRWCHENTQAQRSRAEIWCQSCQHMWQKHQMSSVEVSKMEQPHPAKLWAYKFVDTLIFNNTFHDLDQVATRKTNMLLNQSGAVKSARDTWNEKIEFVDVLMCVQQIRSYYFLYISQWRSSDQHQDEATGLWCIFFFSNQCMGKTNMKTSSLILI